MEGNLCDEKYSLQFHESLIALKRSGVNSSFEFCWLRSMKTMLLLLLNLNWLTQWRFNLLDDLFTSALDKILQHAQSRAVEGLVNSSDYFVRFNFG